MQVKVLGCSGGIGAGLKTTCLRVNASILIDAGTGLELLTQEEMLAIRHLFITHAHLDHIACLPLMLPSVFERLSEPLNVYASRTVLDALKTHIFNWTVWPDYSRLPVEGESPLRFVPLEPGESAIVDDLEFSALAVSHPTPTQGYLVRGEGGAFAFSGDTGHAPGFWRALARVAGLRHLLVDVSFPNAEQSIARASGHYTPQRLAADLAGWPGGPQIHISHLKPGFEETIMAECLEALADRPVRRLAGGDLIEI